MPTTVEIKGEFELKIKRLIDAGLYGNIAEAVRDALRHMHREYDEKEILIGKGIEPRLGVEGVRELNEDYETLKRIEDW